MLGDASRYGTSAQGLGQQVVGEIIERRKVREEEQVGKGEGWRYGSRKRSQDCVRTPTWGARWTEEEVVSVVNMRERGVPWKEIFAAVSSHSSGSITGRCHGNLRRSPQEGLNR